MNADITVFNAIHGLAGVSNGLDLTAIFLAKYLGYFMVLLTIWLLIVEKDKMRRFKALLTLVLSVLVGSGLIKEAINFFFYRARPFVEFGFTPLVAHDPTASMPSGHAVGYFIVATAVYLMINKKWGTWFFVGASLIGIARVFAGVHYPLDVVAGAALGIGVTYLIRYVLAKTMGGKVAEPVEVESNEASGL